MCPFMRGATVLGLLLLPCSSLWADGRNWPFTTPAEYTYDAEKIEVNAGRAQLIQTNNPVWWNAAWNYRRAIYIDSATQPQALSEYPLYFTLDTQSLIAAGRLQADGRDMRIITQGGASAPVWAENWNTANTRVWVQAPSIPAASGTTLQMYYGNPAAASVLDKRSVFSYTTEKPIYRIVSSRDYNLNLTSFYDNTALTLEGISQVVNSQVILPFNSTVVKPTSILNTTKPLAGRLDGNGGESIIPISYAGTQFAYGGLLETDRWEFLSPYGTAQIRIFSGASATPAWSGSVAQGNTRTADVDIATNTPAIIESDLPILMHHQTTNARYSFHGYPIQTELFGIHSRTVKIAAFSNGTIVNAYNSMGLKLIDNQAINRGQMLTIAGGAGLGAGPAVRVVASNGVGVIQQDDQDGNEATTFLPDISLDTLFVLPVDADYIAVACPNEGTVVSLIDALGNTVATQTATSSYAAIFPRKILFSATYTAGTAIVSSQPVYVMYEENSSNSDETNLTGEKDVRQAAYPAPLLSLGNELGRYPQDSPTIEPISNTKQPFTTLGGFSATEVAPAGSSITYILTSNNGATWYWYNAGWQLSNLTAEQSNFASLLNAHVGTLPSGTGEFRFRAFLQSNGASLPQLDNVFLNYAMGEFSLLQVSGPNTDIYQRRSAIPVTVALQNFTNLTLTIVSSGLKFAHSVDGEVSANYIVLPDAGNPTMLDSNSTTQLAYHVEVGSSAPVGSTTVNAYINVTSAVQNYDLTTALTPLLWDVQDYARGSLVIQSVTSPFSSVAHGQSKIPVAMQIVNSSKISLTLNAATLVFSPLATGFAWAPAPGNPTLLNAESSGILNFLVEVSGLAPLGVTRVDATLAAHDPFVNFNLTGAASTLNWTVFKSKNEFYPVRPTLFKTKSMEYVTFIVEISQDVETTLELYNMAGERVCELMQGRPGIGRHELKWYGDNGSVGRRGKAVASGVYVAILKSGSFQKKQKMIVLR